MRVCVLLRKTETMCVISSKTKERRLKSRYQHTEMICILTRGLNHSDEQSVIKCKRNKTKKSYKNKEKYLQRNNKIVS